LNLLLTRGFVNSGQQQIDYRHWFSDSLRPPYWTTFVSHFDCLCHRCANGTSKSCPVSSE